MLNQQHKHVIITGIFMLMLAVLACGGGATAIDSSAVSEPDTGSAPETADNPAAEDSESSGAQESAASRAEEMEAGAEDAAQEAEESAFEEGEGDAQPATGDGTSEQSADSGPQDVDESGSQDQEIDEDAQPGNSASGETAEDRASDFEESESEDSEEDEDGQQAAEMGASEESETTDVAAPDGDLPSEEESAALASLKEEITFASTINIQPIAFGKCEGFGEDNSFLSESPLILIVPTMTINDLQQPAIDDGLAIVVATIVPRLEQPIQPEATTERIQPLEGIEPILPIEPLEPILPSDLLQPLITRSAPSATATATPVPARIAVESASGSSSSRLGLYNICASGIPRDQEIMVSLRAPNGQIYEKAFVWQTSSNTPQWLSPQQSGAITPISADNGSLIIGIQIPFGPFPAGEWQVDLTGGNVNLSSSADTSSRPKIAIPDFPTIDPFDNVIRQSDCATYDLSSGAAVAINGAGFEPGTILPIGFYINDRSSSILGGFSLVNGKAAEIDEDGRFHLDVDSDEFSEAATYSVIAVTDPQRTSYTRAFAPQVSCFKLQ